MDIYEIVNVKNSLRNNSDEDFEKFLGVKYTGIEPFFQNISRIR
jgi:hypothetical protein